MYVCNGYFRYLDKMMGTKFFDVDDLKNWYRGKEGVSSKSRRMIEQISRMFDIPGDGKTALRRLSSAGSDCQLPLSTSEPKLICNSSSQNSISTCSKEGSVPPNESADASNGNEESSGNNTNNFLSYELCSIILNKLLKVHSEYQSRFGSGIIVTEEGSGVSSAEGGEGDKAAAKPTTTTVVVAINGGAEKAESDANSVSKEGKANSDGNQGSSCKGSHNAVVEVHKSGIIKGLLTRLFKGDCVNVNSTEQTVPSVQVDADNSSVIPTSTSIPMECSPDPEVNEDSVDEDPRNNFMMIESVPDTHRYRLTSLQPQNQKNFVKAVQKEVTLMRGSLPAGIFVKTYEDRMVIMENCCTNIQFKSLFQLDSNLSN